LSFNWIKRHPFDLYKKHYQVKVLIVCSKTNGKVAPFITEQVESLRVSGIELDYFFIEQKGIMGYLQSLTLLKQTIKMFEPDVIHAHYGLSGLLANLQRRVPVVTTYHGSDINDPRVKCYSNIAIRLSRYNIFVSQRLADAIRHIKRYSVIPCGVDMSLFHPIEKQVARDTLGWSQEGKYIIFSGNPEDKVKNFALAQQAVSLLPNVQLIPLVGFTRDEVNLLLNAADVALMTSFTEGSPQFIKEAMACNCPIVSTDVGDVKSFIKDIEGCYIASYKHDNVEKKIKYALNFSEKNRTNGREQMNNMNNTIVAHRLVLIYRTIVIKHLSNRY